MNTLPGAKFVEEAVIPLSEEALMPKENRQEERQSAVNNASSLFNLYFIINPLLNAAKTAGLYQYVSYCITQTA